MKFKFECPDCGQRISATEADINTIGVCPSCQREVVVQAPPSTSPTAPASTSSKPLAPPIPAVVPPARPVVAPVPMAKRVPPAFAELEGTRSSVPVFAFLLCALPIPTLIGLRILGVLPRPGFGFLLGGAGLICLMGLIFAHVDWDRSKGGVVARIVAVSGLAAGYLSLLVTAALFWVMVTDTVAEIKPTAIPDLKARPVSLTPPAPAATPAAITNASPSAAPLLISATAATGGLPDDQVQFFDAKIRPILAEKCYKCHAIETGKSKGGLTLDTRDGLLKGGENGPGLKPGDPDGSILIKAVLYTDSDLQMPPKGEKLSDAEIADLVAWVKMGAPDPRKAQTSR